MSGTDTRIVPVVLSLLLAACATSSLELAPDRPDHPWTPATDANGQIVSDGKRAAGAPTATDYTLPVNSTLANVPPSSDIDRDHAYSLADLIDIAQSNNFLTRTAWNHAREAALAAGIAKSAYLPNLTASVLGGYQKSHNNDSALGLNISGDNRADGVISALSLQWLLFDFGERGAVLNAARQASIISNIAFTGAHQQVIYQVSLAYYAEGAARARVDSATRTVKNAQMVQRAAEERHSRGVGTVVEVAQARQVTAQAELVQVQTEGAARDAYLALISAMGISPLTQIKVADIPERKLPATVPDSVERMVADALGRRPDVLAAYAAERASQESVRAARAEFLPKLFLSATGAYNTGRLGVTAIPAIGQESAGTSNLTGNRLGITLFAGITVPIYDGGFRAAVLEQARAKADSASATLTHTREEAVRQIVAAENGVRTTLSAYSASKSLHAAAETTFEAAFAAYRNGVGSITEATVAESQLLEAKNAETDTYSAALTAAATLALSIGTLGSAPQ